MSNNTAKAVGQAVRTGVKVYGAKSGALAGAAGALTLAAPAAGIPLIGIPLVGIAGLVGGVAGAWFGWEAPAIAIRVGR